MGWKIDPSHTLIQFSIKHLMITMVRGRFKSFDGVIWPNAKRPEASRVEGTVDVASIDTNEPQRDNHLRSADFFDVDNYPQMRFRSTRIESIGDDDFKVYGQLRIKDSTCEIVFHVTNEGQMQDPWGTRRWGFSATTELNRKDFGLTWNVPLEAGGWLVGDEVKVSVELQIIQQETEPAAIVV